MGSYLNPGRKNKSLCADTPAVSVRVPCDLGVHDFRVFPYHYVTVSAVYRFVENYRCGGDPVFPAWL